MLLVLGVQGVSFKVGQKWKKDGNQHQVANVKQTNIILKKLTIESTTNYKLIISENTKHIDIAGKVSLKRQVKAEH